MIATCLCLCVCHVESLNVPNFCLSHMSYVSLKFSCSCYSKYLNIAFTLCLVWCMLLELDFGLKIWELSVQATQTPFSSFCETSFWKKKNFGTLLQSYREQYGSLMNQNCVSAKCYVTSFHIWVLDDIG